MRCFSIIYPLNPRPSPLHRIWVFLQLISFSVTFPTETQIGRISALNHGSRSNWLHKFSRYANVKTLIGKNYDLKLTQSIQNLLSQIDKQNPKFSEFIEEFYELMQARVDLHLESIWVYAALTIRSRNHPKDDPLDRVSAAEDLFQLLSTCSVSCGSSKSVELLAPVVREVYNVSVDLFKSDLSLKRDNKVMRKMSF